MLKVLPTTGHSLSTLNCLENPEKTDEDYNSDPSMLLYNLQIY